MRDKRFQYNRIQMIRLANYYKVRFSGKSLKQQLHELLCLLFLFGHEYKRVGNQYTKYLKCKKCGRIV
jgi:hypothetical protein